MTSTAKSRPSRLGRGLSSLMGTPVQVATLPPVPAEALAVAPTVTVVDAPAVTSPATDSVHRADGTGLYRLSLEQIRPNPFQPRQGVDEAALASLAASLKADGLMQPVVVRPISGQDQVTGQPIAYELVAGERRWRAAKLAGLTEIPALVRELTDRQSAEFALIENLQREDLNPLERAHAFRRLADQFHLSHEEIAQRVGVDRTTITNLLRLLDLHPEIQDMIRHGLLSAGQAKALAGVAHPDQQSLLVQKAVRGGWSVRQLEAAVRAHVQGDPAANEPSPVQIRATHLDDLAEQIGQQLGTKVRVKPGRKKGSGALVIEFYSLDQFDQLMQRLGVHTDAS